MAKPKKNNLKRFSVSVNVVVETPDPESAELFVRDFIQAAFEKYSDNYKSFDVWNTEEIEKEEE